MTTLAVDFYNAAMDEPSTVRIICNGQPREVPAGTSVAGLLDELGLAPRQVAVEVNLELVPRGAHCARQLADGDRLELVTLVGGG